MEYSQNGQDSRTRDWSGKKVSEDRCLGKPSQVRLKFDSSSKVRGGEFWDDDDLKIWEKRA